MNPFQEAAAGEGGGATVVSASGQGRHCGRHRGKGAAEAGQRGHEGSVAPPRHHALTPPRLPPPSCSLTTMHIPPPPPTPTPLPPPLPIFLPYAQDTPTPPPTTPPPYPPTTLPPRILQHTSSSSFGSPTTMTIDHHFLLPPPLSPPSPFTLTKLRRMLMSGRAHDLDQDTKQRQD